MKSRQYLIIVCILVIIAAFVVTVNSECPRACRGRGRCLANDMCECYKNFMEADCSGRVCPFGLSVVDIPKGDLDSNNFITGASANVLRNSQLYPSGTTEKYPNMVDSDGQWLSNTAHPYAECSNKGQCDRGSGTCECIEGYEGSACEKNVCPNLNGKICNKRGVCELAKEVAFLADGNEYKLWDWESTQACVCDAGYYGAACERKKCKYDYDPVYFDRHNSYRFSNWTIMIAVKSNTTSINGNYSIRFFDNNGEDWYTAPIGYNASCFELMRRLEELPNDVIPRQSVRCQKWQNFQQTDLFDDPLMLQISLGQQKSYFGIKYTLAFPRNPGDLKQPQIYRYLDGKRPTLFASPSTTEINTFVYPNGFHGEEYDYFTFCEGVDVTLKSTTSYMYFDDLTPLETRRLQRCLGGSDTLNHIKSASAKIDGQVYDWDYGTIYNPHLIKLVDQSSQVITDLCNRTVKGNAFRNSGRVCEIKNPPGFFAVGYYSASLDRYLWFNRALQDYSSTTKFSVFTTTGIVQMASEDSEMFTKYDYPYNRTVYLTNSSSVHGVGYMGAIDCETSKTNVNGVLMCVERGSIVFFMDLRISPVSFLNNPKYFNLYKVSRIYQYSMSDSQFPQHEFFRRRVDLDKSINFHVDRGAKMRVYVFTPPVDAYPYVAECSNRGLCEENTGICNCFEGFEGDACSVIKNVKK